MRLFHNLNYDFMGKRTMFYFISGTLLLVGLVAIAIKGFQFGIDFKGGSEIALEFQKPIEITDIRKHVDKIGIGNVEVKTFGGSTGVLIRTELQELPSKILPQVKEKIESIIKSTLPGVQIQEIESDANAITYSFVDASTAEIVLNNVYNSGFQTSNAAEDVAPNGVVVRIGIADWIKTNLVEAIKDNSFEVKKEDKVGPKVGKELKTDAIIAVLLSLIAIMIYIGFRFKFAFAIGAVIALFHDVLITLGLFVILYGVIPGLNLDITVTVVAAFLTLVGYSINDTVIVFDRVREQLKIHKTVSLEVNMNEAINRTMARTMITVLTTIVTVVVLLIFGGDVLRGFAFALLIGLITGTYSSVFVASAFVLEYANRSKSKVNF